MPGWCTSLSSNNAATIRSFECVFAQVITVALTLVATSTVVMFVMGGFKFLTAGGDKDAVARARHTLTYAVIGLLVAISSWMILQLLGTFLGANLTTFSLNF